MKIYLISQNVNNDWDTYDSAVVIAPDKAAAQKMCPSDFHVWSDENNSYMFKYADGRLEKDDYTSWAHPECVTVQYLGEAAAHEKQRVVCASFNAG